MKTADYDFPLPEELIASRPVEVRDRSRLMVMRKNGQPEHTIFSNLPSLLGSGDMLILNNSKVFPARITGVKPDGSSIEILLVRQNSDGTWNVMTRGRYSGEVTVRDMIRATITKGRTAHFNVDIHALVWEIGNMPLPPYIMRNPDEQDRERYQTVYAEVDGSIAAPTAGLHFTPDLLDRLRSAGVLIRTITLHVGIGTFRPVKTDRLDDHVMESESFEIRPDLFDEIARVRARGGRIIAAGTTTVRTLEGYASGNCSILSANGVIRGTTDIFIREGYRPMLVDGLITNFHLPCSTPLMLASVFAGCSGRKRLLAAYKTAISMGYRFFSYGDAMLLL